VREGNKKSYWLAALVALASALLGVLVRLLEVLIRNWLGL
jgi:hypothetical protein